MAECNSGRPDEPVLPAEPWRRAGRHLCAIAVVVALTAGLYVSSLGHALVWDDGGIVEVNPHIRSTANVSWFFTPRYWREQRPGRSYRPLVEASIAVNWVVADGLPMQRRVGVLRAANIALLAGVGALLYWLVWRLARSVSAALVAGLVFACHPMHLETITLVKNRSELQAGLFGLLALLWFLRAADGQRRWWVWWLGSTLATAAALGSKEVALALPLVLSAAAILLAPAGRRGRVLGLTAPMWLLAFGLVVLLFTAMPEKYGQLPLAHRLRVREFAALGPGARSLVVIKTVGVYLGLLVWPFTLCADRAFEVPLSLWRPDVLASLGGMLLVIGLAVWTRRRSPLVAFALVWLAAALGPVANLVPVPMRPIAEPRLFAATMPYAILAGLALGRLRALWLASRPSQARSPGDRGGSQEGVRNLIPRVPETRSPTHTLSQVPITVILVGWLVAMGAATVTALPAWRTEETLWERTARQSPDVRRPQYNHGHGLMKQGRFPESVEYFKRAVRLDDLVAHGLANLGRGLAGHGRREETKRLLRLALSWDPDDLHSAPVHEAFADELRWEGRLNAALYEMRATVRVSPKIAISHYGLAQVLLELQRIEEGIASLRRARDLAPDEPHFRLALAEALQLAGRFGEALAECQAVIDRWPGQPPAREAEDYARQIRQRMAGG